MAIEQHNYKILVEQKMRVVKENIELKNKICDLEMEIQIEKGLGYQPKEARKKEKLEILIFRGRSC